MQNIKKIEEILNLTTEDFFLQTVLDLYDLHRKYNIVYKQYLDYLNKNQSISQLQDIVYLPINFFKTHVVKLDKIDYAHFFLSSGTTYEKKSCHYIYSLEDYKKVTLKIFELFYGTITQYEFYALLPSYLSNKNSSLVYMVNYFMSVTHQKKYFYESNYQQLIKDILKPTRKKKVLIGVSYALKNLADSYEVDFSDVILIETGGMKGMDKEYIKEELHNLYKTKLNVKQIHTEYGMSELLSQGYGLNDNFIKFPPWVRVECRDLHDPFSKSTKGGLNIIDLANIYSCPFIETEDLGYVDQRGLELKGRIDNTSIRGCNLLMIDL